MPRMIMLCCVFLGVEDTVVIPGRQQDELGKPPTAPVHAEAGGHKSQSVKRNTWSPFRAFSSRKSLHHFAAPVYRHRCVEIHHPPSEIFGNEYKYNVSCAASAFTNIGVVLTPISLTHEVPCLAARKCSDTTGVQEGCAVASIIQSLWLHDGGGQITLWCELLND